MQAGIDEVRPNFERLNRQAAGFQRRKQTEGNRGLSGSCHRSRDNGRFHDARIADCTMIKTIEWTADGVRMIDQRKLPTVEEYPVFKTYQEVAEAIRVMVVRGAPAIGVAAAMGVALGVRGSKTQSLDELQRDFETITTTL